MGLGEGGGGTRFCLHSDCHLYNFHWGCSRTINFVSFLVFNGEYDFDIKVTIFYPESRDMTIFGKYPCQKWSNCIYTAITFEILVQNQ